MKNLIQFLTIQTLKGVKAKCINYHKKTTIQWITRMFMGNMTAIEG